MDSEVIDLTEETKYDLDNDSRYAKIEESVLIEKQDMLIPKIDNNSSDEEWIDELKDYNIDSSGNRIDNNNILNKKFTSLKRNLVETNINKDISNKDSDDIFINLFESDVKKPKKRSKLTAEEKLIRRESKECEKKQKQRERTELNRQKEKLKAKQIKLKEANKYLDLKNASQYCTTIISQTLIDKFLTSDNLLRKLFEEGKLNLDIDKFTNNKQPIIKWKRVLHSRNDTLIADKSVLNLSEIIAKEEIEEDHLIYVINNEHFVKMVYKFVLSNGEHPEEIFEFDENDHDNITLLTFVSRKLKNREHRDFLQMMNEDQKRKKTSLKQFKLPIIKRMNVDEAILNINLEMMKNDAVVELKLKIKFQFADNQMELVNLIYNLSNSMADAPYKRWRNEQEGFDWFVDGDSKTGTVNIKELPNDVYRLWLKHLLLFDRVSLSIAKSIAQEYPNLMALKNKYDSLISVTDKELLLTNVVNKYNRSVSSEISKRIYKFITETNEDEILA